MKQVKLYGRCGENAEMSVYANQVLAFEGRPTPIKTDADYDEYLLAEFEVSVGVNHNTNIKVVCNRGWVSVGTVDTNFCQDINPELSLEVRQEVWKSRKENSKLYSIKYPYIYYSNDGGEYADHTMLEKHDRHDERFNIVHNGKTIDLRSKPDYPDMEDWVGWFYALKENEVISFDINVFLPVDYINFMVDYQITQDDFNEILFSTR